MNRQEMSVNAVISRVANGELVRILVDDVIASVVSFSEQPGDWWNLNLERGRIQMQVRLHGIERVFAEVQS